MRSVVGVTPWVETAAARSALMNALLAGVELADDDQQEELLDVGELAPHELRVLGGRPETGQELRYALEKRPLAVREPLPSFVEDFHLKYTPPQDRRRPNCTPVV